MSKNTYKHTKVAGPFKSALMGLGGFILFIAGASLWAEGSAAILPTLKIGGVGAVLLGVGAVIPSKNQFTQR